VSVVGILVLPITIDSQQQKVRNNQTSFPLRIANLQLLTLLHSSLPPWCCRSP